QPEPPAPAPPPPRSQPKQVVAPVEPPRAKETRPTPKVKQVAKADTKREMPKAPEADTKSKIKVNIDDVVTRSDSKTKTTAKQAARSTPQNTAAQKAARERAERLEQALTRLEEGLSRSTSITLPEGQDGDGGGSADYGALVKERFDAAWIGTEGSDTRASVKVSITISRDGRVRSATIVNRSNDAALNRSVQSALDRVKIVPPFPPDIKAEQLTFQLTFSHNNRRSQG
ncbi:MAG: TonB family protein, partial [Verrucomicrobiota bacterium]